ncbi:MAG TPA: fatty acid CoA ligase family protein [Opitutaceae bacterium]|nr:fatty acid CoA ligase family protein [Opitutaceae bacterium]
MSANIARHLDAMALAQPRSAAIKVPRGRTPSGEIDYLALTFAELAAEVGAWQARLSDRGVRRGDRALVAVRPGLPLIASAFALFKLGAVPVVIDPGMGLRAALAAVARTRPRALVGIPLVQAASRIFAKSFRSVEARVPVPGSLTARLGAGRGPIPPAADCAPTDRAAILFTSGSTGMPKGVAYEHGMFEAQVRMIQAAYGIAPGEVDLPLLPIFALFNPALGMTSVIPEIDPRRPAAADPAKIVKAIRQEGVTNSFGSPTLWRIVADHCRARRLTLPSLRRVLCAGAPVPAALWEESRALLPNGRLHSPYGATEALPLTSLSSDEFLGARASAAGAPVGRPLPGIRVKIIAIEEGPLPTLDLARELPAGEIGEIIVQGAVVTREYDGLPEANAAAKIADPAAGGYWHRMGDCGFLDPAGALWFCGRKVERVRTAAATLHTEPCERVFRGHPRAARCALVGLGPPGSQRPALVAEAAVRGQADARALAGELRALARQNPASAAIDRFYFKPRFPVDVRHNAKIHRLALARWAARARGYDAP